MNRTRSVILGSVGLVVLALAWFSYHPLRLPTNMPYEATPLPYRDDGHSVLLFVSETTLANDLQWANLLEQYFGGVDLLPLDRLSTRAFEGRSVVMFARGATGDLPEAAHEDLRPYVEAGLTVILEAPEGRWAEIVGVRADGVETRSHLGWPTGPTSRRIGLAPHERLIPPSARTIPYTAVRYFPQPGEGYPARSIASPAGRPLAWQRREGRGAWNCIAIDFGELATRMRQAPPPTSAAGPGEPTSTTAPPTLASAEPWLDAWLDALLTDTGPAPWPRLWSAPYADDGWLVVSTDPTLNTNDNADGSESVATVFTWPDVSDWRAADVSRNMLGFGPLQPAGRVASIASQLANAGPSPVVMPANGAWSEHANAFGSLATAGVRAVVGPGPPFVFSSGMPFRPLDANGRSVAIWSLPVTARGDVRQTLASTWLRRNGSENHGLIHLATTSNDSTPWTSVAAAANHRVATVEEVLAFTEARRDQRVQWSFDGAVLQLQIHPGPGRSDLGIAIPRQWQRWWLSTWWSSWPAAARKVHSLTSSHVVFRIPPEGGALNIRYQRSF